MAESSGADLRGWRTFVADALAQDTPWSAAGGRAGALLYALLPMLQGALGRWVPIDAPEPQEAAVLLVPAEGWELRVLPADTSLLGVPVQIVPGLTWPMLARRLVRRD